VQPLPDPVDAGWSGEGSASLTSRQKSTVGIVLLFIIIVGDLITGAVSIHAPGGSRPSVPLGTWTSMPFNQTELMGNTSYRGVLASRSSGGSSGLAVGLVVGCVNPSNTPGATLQLQYANYSDTTHLNSSNFVNVGILTSILIDNSANQPCPGLLESNTNGLPNINLNPTLFEFRVVGSAGGGPGDNPRFSSVSVYVIQTAYRIPTVVVSTRSTTAFTAFVYTIWQVPATITENFDWIASSNGVLVESGANSCSISAGSNSCSVSTTFGTIFGTTPNVVCTSRNAEASISIPIGTISLLSAQTLTV